MNKMSQMNAVIIGCGAIGPIHAEAITNSDAAHLYGVCDVLPERAEALALRYGCRAFTSYAQVLADEAVHSVHICTPHYLHAEMAVQAAAAGKQILLEKPIAMNVLEARAVSNAVRTAGVSCCAILQNRLNPCIEAAKSLIDDGSYGKLLGIKAFLTWKRTAEYYVSADWRGKWATEGGGLLINQAVHMLDLLYYLGGEVEAVKGHIDTRVLQEVIEVEDTAEATFYYKDGKRGWLYATNGYSEDSPFFIEMHLEQGVLRYIDNKLILKSNGEEQILADDMQCSKSSIGKAYWGSGHAKLIDQFYQTLAGHLGSYSSLQDAAYSMGILDAIYASSNNDRREMIELF
ncbi:Gfo/Idh/MocA family oxidoreductase [Paenibacillus motobuensis]|uniref:Gfo/Idh/MocA family oxidoreductase n=2 Tax=Paenibacillus motobuensis TaxID=295324 RepID=A0ABP3HNT9_9BACL